MDQLDTMRAFVAVAEEAGFAAAARRLRMSPPAVTRAIGALEERLGGRLLHRTTRIVRLTEMGARYLDDARRILAELAEADASAAGEHTEPQGALTVTAPVMFGRIHVAPVVFDFLAQYPRVTVRLLTMDRLVDMIEEGIDVAVRIAVLTDSSLSAVRVGSVRRMVLGSPAFLKAHGIPKDPADLKRFPVTTFSSGAAPDPWRFGPSSSGRTVSPPAALIVNSAEVAIAAAVAGQGLTRALSYQVAPELKSGKLKVVLEEFEPPPLPIHIVHVEGRRANARVRAFVDFAAQRLRGNRALR
jgi:DNA-binding transcriptional LysR family regulator